MTNEVMPLPEPPNEEFVIAVSRLVIGYIFSGLIVLLGITFVWAFKHIFT